MAEMIIFTEWDIRVNGCLSPLAWQERWFVSEDVFIHLPNAGGKKNPTTTAITTRVIVDWLVEGLVCAALYSSALHMHLIEFSKLTVWDRFLLWRWSSSTFRGWRKRGKGGTKPSVPGSTEQGFRHQLCDSRHSASPSHLDALSSLSYLCVSACGQGDKNVSVYIYLYIGHAYCKTFNIFLKNLDQLNPL